MEAFDIFSQGEMSERDSCGVDLECELGAWSSELVSSSACVLSSSAVELVGDGDPSDSSWEFVSECGPVAGSDVSVPAGVGVSAPSVVTVVCEDLPSDAEWDFVEPQSVFLSKKRNLACVEGQEDMNYDGTPVKAPPCPKRRMITPLPHQRSFSSMEEGSLWSAQERTAIARIEQYVNNSNVVKLDIAEVEENSLVLRRRCEAYCKKCDNGRQEHFRSFQCERKRRASSRKQVAMG